MVVTPGVASARSRLFVHDDANNFGGSTPASRKHETWPSLFRCPPSASHVRRNKTHRIKCVESGDYKLLEYTACNPSGSHRNPCHASRGHSISLICSVIRWRRHEINRGAKNHKAASVVRITAQTAPSKNGGGDPWYPHIRLALSNSLRDK